MAILTLVMVVAYLIYGRALIKTLTKTGGGAAKESPVVKNLYYATAAFCLCFAAESLIWIISSAVETNPYDDEAGILGAFYAFNWLSLVIIIAMFRQGNLTHHISFMRLVLNLYITMFVVTIK
jgi:hypothetical protein